MTGICLITTTIRTPHNLRAWREALGDAVVLIVAGDLKSPHDSIEALLKDIPGINVYLRPDDQRRWESSDPTGWNCIQRRNLALLEALTYQPEIVVTVDDDNWPVGYDAAGLLELLDGEPHPVQVTASETGWFNAAGVLTPPVVHRGYPIGRRHDNPATRTGTVAARVGVHASLWLGDPDIDATERICCAPDIVAAGADTVLDTGTWCPFNSQATAYRAELAPLMMCWPGVGRMDDIWASYLARRVMDRHGWLVHYGRPLVRQDRNPHDLAADVAAEQLGYEHTEAVTDVLRAVDLDGTATVADAMRRCHSALITECGWLPDRTVAAFGAWIRDLEEVAAACTGTR
jgi:hypothetical protein